MKISPPQPYNNDSYAELVIFDAFRNIEMDEAICFNSLHLVSHREKRISEIDFILVCTKGIFVFEVKGGRVFQKQGKWFSKSKQKTHAIQNPFNQSRGALFSLVDSLISNGFLLANVPIGYGVFVPNTISLSDSVEYDQAMCGTKKNLKGFRSWLSRFIEYWVSKNDEPKALCYEEIQTIANYLRPGSISKEILLSSFNHLNSMQQQVVTAFENNKRTICEGAAGTGKTFVIEALAKEYVSREENLLILCESKWLKNKLKYNLSSVNIVVATIDSLEVESRRAFVNQYDAVIVDEAQDMYDEKKLEVIERFIKGGLPKGKWLFFQDLVNQSGSYGGLAVSSVKRVEEYSDVRLTLDISYRYTRPILNFLSRVLDVDAIPTSKIDGSNVEVFSSSTRQAEVMHIERGIAKLINMGYLLSDITILSPNTFLDSVISSLPTHLLNQVVQIDDFNIKNLPRNQLSFSEIKNFRGLDNKVVLLVDFSQRVMNNASQAYIAFTRASDFLFIVEAAGNNVFSTKIEPGVEVGSVMDDWQKVLDLTLLLDECRTLMELRFPPPKCGFKIQVDKESISEVELAWIKSKVCIFADHVEFDEVKKWIKLGWKCFQAPLSSEEIAELLYSMSLESKC
ncbi:nuclease-related domain-containing DEAD/DEAH box helicase [Aliivibrio fischeri]|uniref:nuclease-related domain-containing DEAD/DEAH box helicase n=1 Tax=Aliivibrio fischeri TaxID=668 RepID=UPI0012D97FEC|nr:NERD domain-containing protein [Aliivibrio fischeri]MUK26206.1 AAA family ATPase [Aliivibrio fischeri]MUK33829.1 AAA family ATPase [Aliivibrio fischeri]